MSGVGSTVPTTAADGRRPRRTGRSQRRFRGPARRPMTYGPFARFSDWRHAGLDARARLPGPDSNGQVVTQTLVMLERQARDIAALARKAYEEESAGRRAALARNHADQPAARRAVQAAEASLREASIAPTDGELTVRRPGDETIDDSLVRERRRREHLRRVTDARNALTAAEARLHTLVREAAVLTAELRSRRDIARASVERMHEHIRRRRAAYWRRLVRLHPDGEQINTLLAPDWPELPDWLDGPLDRHLDTFSDPLNAAPSGESGGRTDSGRPSRVGLFDREEQNS